MINKNFTNYMNDRDFLAGLQTGLSIGLFMGAIIGILVWNIVNHFIS